jgi:hypothetical protein
MRFLRLVRGDSFAAQNIFTLRHWFAMPGIYAVFNPAKVVKHFA